MAEQRFLLVSKCECWVWASDVSQCECFSSGAAKVSLTCGKARLPRTTIGQLSPGGKTVLAYHKARLPEAGLRWGTISLQDIAILLLS